MSGFLDWLNGLIARLENSTMDEHCGVSNYSGYCYNSSFAINAYLYSLAFIFGLSQVITRGILSKKTSTTQIMSVNTASHRTVKRGSTRLIPELLTASFLFRALWFFMKGAPGEQWACYPESFKHSFVNATSYGSWRYALREMFNRFSTMLSFSAFTVLVVFWAGMSAASGKFHSNDGVARSRLDEFSDDKAKKKPARYTCCQGFYVSLNVWLYLFLLIISVINFIPNDLDEHCLPANRTPEPKTAATCETSPGYSWHDVTFLTSYKNFIIVFTSCLYVLIVIAMIIFGARVASALESVHLQTPETRKKPTSDIVSSSTMDPKKQELLTHDIEDVTTKRPRRRFCGIGAMRCKIFTMIAVTAIFFVPRFFVFVLPVANPTEFMFENLTCALMRYVLCNV